MILSAICLLAYPIVIKYKRKGFYYALAPFAFIVAVLDIIANYTEWWFVFGKPPKGAYTISKYVRWLAVNGKHESHREFARMLQVILDAGEDDGKH